MNRADWTDRTDGMSNSGQPSQSSLLPPLARAWWAWCALLAIFVAYSHYRPIQAYPLAGLYEIAGITIVGLLALLIGRRMNVSLAGVFFPGMVLALFTGWAWLRTMFSSVPSEGLPGLTTLLNGLLLFWLGFFLVRSRAAISGTDKRISGIELTIWFFSAMGALYAIHAVAQYHYLFPRQYQNLIGTKWLNPGDPVNEGIIDALIKRRVGSQFGNPNVLCAFLAMCLPMMLSTLRNGLLNGRRWLAGGMATMIAVLFYAAFRTASAGGLIVLAMTFGLMLMGLRLNWKIGKLAETAGICVLFFGAASISFAPHSAIAEAAAGLTQTPRNALSAIDVAQQTSNRDKNLLGKLRQAKTLRQRGYYLMSGYEMWRENPLLGNGWGSFGRLYGRHRILGAGETKYAHNFLAQILVETGMPGIILMLLFIGALASRIWRGRGLLLSNLNLLAMACAIFAFLLHSLGDYTFYVNEVYSDYCLLAGVLVAALSTSQNRGNTKAAISSLAVSGAIFIAGLWPVMAVSQFTTYYQQSVKDLWEEGSYIQTRKAEIRQSFQSGSETQELGSELAELVAEEQRLPALTLDAADRALRISPRDPRLWDMRAHIYFQMGNLPSAISDQEKAVSLHPDSASIRAELSRFEWQRGDKIKALDVIAEATRLYPLNQAYHRQYAEMLRETGNRAKAEAEAREAIRTSFYPKEKKENEELLQGIIGK